MMRQTFLRVLSLASIFGAVSVRAAVSDSLLGRWIVVGLGGQPANVPYKVRLYVDYGTYPDDAESNVVMVEAIVSGYQSCYFAVNGSDITGAPDLKQSARLCTSTMDGGAATYDCEGRAGCVERIYEDENYFIELFAQTSHLKWRKSRGNVIVYSLDGDGHGVVLAHDPEWPR